MFVTVGQHLQNVLATTVLTSFYRDNEHGTKAVRLTCFIHSPHTEMFGGLVKKHQPQLLLAEPWPNQSLRNGTTRTCCHFTRTSQSRTVASSKPVTKRPRTVQGMSSSAPENQESGSRAPLLPRQGDAEATLQ